MKTWLISDTHFDHKKMVDDGWRDFKSLDDMNEQIIKRWNSLISPNDIVFHLGDVSIGNRSHYKRKIEPRLNGRITYIKGNHDPSEIAKIKNIIFEVANIEIELVHNPEDRTGCTDYVIHGHIHARGEKAEQRKAELAKIIEGTKTLFYNVNLEFHDYKPIDIQEVLNYFLKNKMELLTTHK